MKAILPAVLAVTVLACSSEAATVKTLATHQAAVQLGAKPVTVTIPLANTASRALAIARDPNRHLTLRVEGISITEQPGIVYDVRIDGVPNAVGVLSFYGVEESNGKAIAGFPIDEASQRALSKTSKQLKVTFVPRGLTDTAGRETVAPRGRPGFTKLVIAEE